MGAPVPFTCPAIDKAIRETETARNYIEQGLSCIEELLGRNGLLEELRDQNAKLREWGESLEEEIQDLTNDLRDSEDHVEELLKERAELLNRIQYLENKHE